MLDVDPAPQRGTAPQFSAHVCCGHTDGWIKMPVGTDRGRPGDTVTVLDHRWRSSSPKRDIAPPLFGPCLLWPNGRRSHLLLALVQTVAQKRQKIVGFRHTDTHTHAHKHKLAAFYGPRCKHYLPVYSTFVCTKMLNLILRPI